jgi:hypothetical protein
MGDVANIPGPEIETGAFLRARALALLGIAYDPKLYGWLFDDMLTTVGAVTIPTGWRRVVVGTGDSTTLLNDEGAGVNNLTSGANAASSMLALSDLPAIANVATAPWYVAHRMKCISGKTAQTTMVSGLCDPTMANKTISGGFNGALNANNFVFQYDGLNAGAAIDTGVVFDLNFHVYEMWGRGDGKVHFAFDFGADLGNVTMAAPAATAHSLYRLAANGTDAVARLLRSDYAAVFCKRT